MSDETKSTANQPSEPGTPGTLKPNNPPEPPVAGNPEQAPGFVHGNNPTPK
jgi:hypothetical protein